MALRLQFALHEDTPGLLGWLCLRGASCPAFRALPPLVNTPLYDCSCFLKSCSLTAAHVSFLIFRVLAKKAAIAEGKPAARPKAAKARKAARAKPVQPDEPIWLSGQPASGDETKSSGLQGFTFSLKSALMIGDDHGPVVRRTGRPAVRKAPSAGDCGVPQWSCGCCHWMLLAAAAQSAARVLA